LAIVCIHVGLLDESWGEAQRALTINPDSMLARVRIGVVPLYRVDYAKAIELLQGVPEDANPSYRSRALADALFRSGRTREAAALVDDFLRRYPSDEGGSLTSVRALLLAREGKRDEAEAAIAHAIEIGHAAGHFHHTAYNVGCAYAILGRPDLAVHWLQVAAGDGFPCYPFYARDETLDGIRSDPAFKTFLGGLKTQWEGFQKLR
jgi:tetratricopeptide (TPR) repeat protein